MVNVNVSVSSKAFGRVSVLMSKAVGWVPDIS